MKKADVDMVVACLGDQRRVFHYFKDRYCLDLIDMEMARQQTASMSIASLKASRLGRYLHKPLLAGLLKHCASGRVNRADLALGYPVDPLAFTVTLDEWGNGERGWDQTSRNQSNLVLQLNFDRGHQAQFQQLVAPNAQARPFESDWHPVRHSGPKTLAWARLDVDLVYGEVLIEEIQNDWLRKAAAALNRVKHRRALGAQIKPEQVVRGLACSFEALQHYVEVLLAPYQRVWAEAMLLAALRFVREELGIDKVYYHSFETGNRLKSVCGQPPKSLYTRLPQQFGFELTHEPPRLLAQHKFARRCLRAIDNPSWYRLAL